MPFNIDTFLILIHNNAMKHITDKLAMLDLAPLDIDVYLAVLLRSKSTITDIARQAKIKRTTIYHHLDLLVASGLVYKTILNKRIFYSAKNPEDIPGIFEKKKNDIDHKRKEFEKIIPNLKLLYSKSHKKPSIEFYEGKSGLKTIYEKMTNTHKNVYCIFSPDSFFKFFSKKENDEFLKTLHESGGILYNLIENTDTAKKHMSQNKSNTLKYKLLPKGFHYETDLIVSNDTLALTSFKNLVGVIIKDEAIAQLQINLFKLIWKIK